MLAAVLGCWQIKLMPYACWLAAVPLAVLAAGLRGTASLSPAVVRLAAVVLLSQATLDAAFGALLSPFQRSGEPAATAAETGDPRRPCFRSANVRRLAALPAGLVAGDIDLGPYIVALSPHRVVAAPYHRLEKGILANHAITHGTPEQAQRTLRALGVDYVALCADRPADRSSEGDKPATTLGARLLDGERFGFLRELDCRPPAPSRCGKSSRPGALSRGSTPNKSGGGRLTTGGVCRRSGRLPCSVLAGPQEASPARSAGSAPAGDARRPGARRGPRR